MRCVDLAPRFVAFAALTPFAPRLFAPEPVAPAASGSTPAARRWQSRSTRSDRVPLPVYRQPPGRTRRATRSVPAAMIEWRLAVDPIAHLSRAASFATAPVASSEWPPRGVEPAGSPIFGVPGAGRPLQRRPPPGHPAAGSARQIATAQAHRHLPQQPLAQTPRVSSGSAMPFSHAGSFGAFSALSQSGHHCRTDVRTKAVGTITI